MRSGLGACAFLVLLAWPVMSVAQIYKCEDQYGRPQFSDKPCAEDAETVIVDTGSAGINMGSQGDYSGVYKASAQRDVRRAIKAKRAEIDALEDTKRRELTALRRSQRYSTNSLAGATRDESLATEMEAVVKDYNGRIEIRMQQLAELRSLLTD